jgi:hypothetical protein
LPNTLNTTTGRLAGELRRLYGPADAAPAGRATGTRALVLEVARPAEWRPLSAVWKGVQADLGLPAPAIAANGSDGLQLWFSLAEPLDPTRARAFLDGLRKRYLADLPMHRVALLATPVPPQGPAASNTEGHWSAFVAADLAPIFEESPWLDLPPGDEGQADLLSRVGSIDPASFVAAAALLQAPPATQAAAAAATSAPAPSKAVAHPDALRFLLKVMNDEAAPLARRIKAAKALLPYGAALGFDENPAGTSSKP